MEDKEKIELVKQGKPYMIWSAVKECIAVMFEILFCIALVVAITCLSIHFEQPAMAWFLLLPAFCYIAG